MKTGWFIWLVALVVGTAGQEEDEKWKKAEADESVNA